MKSGTQYLLTHKLLVTGIALAIVLALYGASRLASGGLPLLEHSYNELLQKIALRVQENV